MAKKRVHELAKQYDMPSSEVMKRLQAYGLDVKAAATAVDTELADAALTGKPKPKAASSNGAKKQQQPQPPAHTGVGFDRPAPRAPRPADNKEAPKKPEDGQGSGNGNANDRSKRPTRSSLQGERAPGAGGGVRRVVIDSQASRRQGPGGGPGGPGGGPPRRPPRRGGRRRRGTYTEPTPQDASLLKADTIRINSGSTVKDVAEYLGVGIAEIIKKLMELGKMATLTQTLADDEIEVIAE